MLGTGQADVVICLGRVNYHPGIVLRITHDLIFNVTFDWLVFLNLRFVILVLTRQKQFWRRSLWKLVLKRIHVCAVNLIVSYEKKKFTWLRRRNDNGLEIYKILYTRALFKSCREGGAGKWIHFIKSHTRRHVNWICVIYRPNIICIEFYKHVFCLRSALFLFFHKKIVAQHKM